VLYNSQLSDFSNDSLSHTADTLDYIVDHSSHTVDILKSMPAPRGRKQRDKSTILYTRSSVSICVTSSLVRDRHGTVDSTCISPLVEANQHTNKTPYPKKRGAAVKLG